MKVGSVRSFFGNLQVTWKDGWTFVKGFQGLSEQLMGLVLEPQFSSPNTKVNT